MTNQHLITPPPELVQQWINEEDGLTAGHIATQAARWGADRELDACCEWFVRDWTDIETTDNLRAARRPKPPTLKEQALEALKATTGSLGIVTPSRASIIRRALEALPND